MSAADSAPNPRDPYLAAAPAPTGAAALSEARLAAIAGTWQSVSRQVRAMDTIELGEIEPATTFGLTEVER